MADIVLEVSATINVFEVEGGPDIEVLNEEAVIIDVGVPALTGPQGPTGAKGDTGDAGPQGLKGDKGDQGDTGSQGPTGATGPAGPAGADGVDGVDGANGFGVPTGGTTGQILAKTSNSDYVTGWIDAPSGGSDAFFDGGSASTIYSPSNRNLDGGNA